MRAKGHGVANLNETAVMWNTPVAQDDQKSPEAHLAMKARMKGGPRSTITSLNVQTKVWPTPAARASKGSLPLDQRDRTMGTLDKAAEQKFSLPAPATSTDGEPSSPPARTSRPRLNPAFASWLMGLPCWWTRAEPISFAAREMESYRCKLRRRLLSFFGGSA
jgi:hypothetical protein